MGERKRSKEEGDREGGSSRYKVMVWKGIEGTEEYYIVVVVVVVGKKEVRTFAAT